MKIVNCLALLVAFGMQLPVAPSSLNVGQEQVATLAEVPAELSDAAMESVVGEWFGRKAACVGAFAGIAAAAVVGAGVIAVTGGTGILGVVILGQVAKVSAVACLAAF